jgi:hypothetical protein
MVREWSAKLLDEGVSATMAANAYRLLRAVMMTAVNEDRSIPSTLCQVGGADRERASERPVLSVTEVLALADVVPDRYRALSCWPRSGACASEVTALERRDVDLAVGTVDVRRAFVEVRGKGLVAGPPKSRAGKRTIAIPPSIVEEHFGCTWPSTLGQARWCSQARSGRPSGAATFNQADPMKGVRGEPWARRTDVFTTCATAGTCSPPAAE